jgi:validoxylamine A 7'-phosphate phosphatase
VETLDLSVFRAAVFDLDGTLITSEPHNRAQWFMLFENHGWTIDEDTYRRNFIGRRGSDVLASTPGPWQDHNLDELYAEALAIVPEGEVAIEAVPGAADLVRWFADREVPRALVTSARKESVGEALDLVGVRDLIEVVVTADDVATGKPDPEGFLLASERLEVPPNQSVAFEDSTNGVAAARAAGYRTVVGVLTTLTAEMLLEAGADLTVEDLNDLL